MARDTEKLRLVKGIKEFFPIYPPCQSGIEQVTSISVEDRLEALPWPVQGVAQAMEGNIEVVASRGSSVIGPLQPHQHVAPDRPASVDQQILKQTPRLQAAPPHHMFPRNVQL